MTGALIGLAAALALIVWLLRGGRRRGSAAPRGDSAVDPVDWEELEEAEREVRDLPAGTGPDELPASDWGPGASKPRPPTRL